VKNYEKITTSSDVLYSTASVINSFVISHHTTLFRVFASRMRVQGTELL